MSNRVISIIESAAHAGCEPYLGLRVFLCHLGLICTNLYLDWHRPYLIYASPIRRRYFNMVAGLTISLLCFGAQGMILWLPAIVGAYLIHFSEPGCVPAAAIVVGSIFQLAIHLSCDPTSLSATRVGVGYSAMIGWLRLAGLGLNLRDGRIGTAMMDEHGEMALCDAPTLLEVISYCVDPQMILGGPLIPFRHVQRTIEGGDLERRPCLEEIFDRAKVPPATIYKADKYGNSQEATKLVAKTLTEPHRLLQLCAALGWFFIFDVACHLTEFITQVAPSNFARSDILISSSLGTVHRVFSIYFGSQAYMLFRFAQWKLSEAVCISAGYGYSFKTPEMSNSIDEGEVYRYEFAGNVDVQKVEAGTWFDESFAGWDITRRRIERMLITGNATPNFPFPVIQGEEVPSAPAAGGTGLRPLPLEAYALRVAALEFLLHGGRLGAFLSSLSGELFSALARRLREKSTPFAWSTPRGGGPAFVLSRVIWPFVLLPLFCPRVDCIVPNRRLAFLIPLALATIGLRLVPERERNPLPKPPLRRGHWRPEFLRTYGFFTPFSSELCRKYVPLIYHVRLNGREQHLRRDGVEILYGL